MCLTSLIFGIHFSFQEKLVGLKTYFVLMQNSVKRLHFGSEH